MRLGTSREAGLGHVQHQERVPWGIATKRLSVDTRGRVVYRYKQPFRDGSTHVVLEPLDFMFRMNGMPRAQGCAGAAIARIVPHRPRGKVDNDKPTAPMSWMQRLKRVFDMPQGTLS